MHFVKLVIVVFLIVYNFLSATCQSKNDLDFWLYSVEKEFSEVEMENPELVFENNSTEFKLIKYHLLSDKYFKPVFGRAYDKMWKGRKSRIANKIIKIKSKKKFLSNEAKNPWAVRLYQYTRGVFYQSFTQDEAIKMVKEIRSQRIKFNLLRGKLSTTSCDYRFLSDLKKGYRDTFNLLLPKEITVLRKQINNSLLLKADEQLTKITDQLSHRRGGYNFLNEIHEAEYKYRDVLQNASEKAINKFQLFILGKENQLLIELLASENQSLKTKTIHEINEFVNRIHSKYRPYYNNEKVLANHQKLLAAKVSLISESEIQIQAEIEEVTDLETLKEKEEFYLLHIESFKSDEVDRLQLLLDDQRKIIIEKKRRKKVEEELKRAAIEKEQLASFKSVLKTNGLINSELFIKIFKGQFNEIELQREGMFFFHLYQEYIYSYGRRYDDKLPKSKVMIYKDFCAEETYRENRFGLETGRYCSKWTMIPSNIYAKKELYSAYVVIKNIFDSDSQKNAWKLIIQSRSGSGNEISELTQELTGITNDIGRLLSINEPQSDGLKRFEDNLIRYALNNSPIAINGQVIDHQIDWTKQRSYESFVNDLIYANARTWSMNKFMKGSITNVRSFFKNNDGIPTLITAKYQFQGLFGYQTGNVKITFENGIPSCLYFWDKPNICRGADRKVVLGLIKGNYISQ